MKPILKEKMRDLHLSGGCGKAQTSLRGEMKADAGKQQQKADKASQQKSAVARLNLEQQQAVGSSPDSNSAAHPNTNGLNAAG